MLVTIPSKNTVRYMDCGLKSTKIKVVKVYPRIKE
jgi:hypothetical protein